MIPAAFVVGVITTILAALTSKYERLIDFTLNSPKLTLYCITVSVVSMKGLGVGVILLVITVGQLFSRLVPAAAPITYAAPQHPIPWSTPANPQSIITQSQLYPTLPLILCGSRERTGRGFVEYLCD